jgi:hypothetical protein
LQLTVVEKFFLQAAEIIIGAGDMDTEDGNNNLVGRAWEATGTCGASVPSLVATT